MRSISPLWLPLALTALLGCGGSPPPTEGEAAAPPPAPTVSGEEARALVASGALLLDVTPPPRNERSRIEGRVNIPLPELRERMGELPRDRPIVVYCLSGRGSPRAGAMLQAEGYDVRVLGARSRWPDDPAP